MAKSAPNRLGLEVRARRRHTLNREAIGYDWTTPSGISLYDKRTVWRTCAHGEGLWRPLGKKFAANSGLTGSLPTRFAVLVSAIRPEANSKRSGFLGTPRSEERRVGKEWRSRWSP